jgi:hypothetical protein
MNVGEEFHDGLVIQWYARTRHHLRIHILRKDVQERRHLSPELLPMQSH